MSGQTTFELKVNPRIEDSIVKMSNSEYEAFKKNVSEEGLKKPIEVMADGTIIDGHHRFRACNELGIEPSYIKKPEIKTIQQAIEYTKTVNIHRRHLNSFQKITNMIRNESRILTTRDIAEKSGISQPVVSRCKTILDREDFPKEYIEQLEHGELAIDAAFKMVKKTSGVQDQILMLEEGSDFQKQLQREFDKDKWDKKNLDSIDRRIKVRLGIITPETKYKKEILPFIKQAENLASSHPRIVNCEYVEENNACYFKIRVKLLAQGEAKEVD